MAGYVSRKSAARWNNAARIVEAGGAGNFFVPGKYRETRKVCTDLPVPGSYPAIAGAAIAAGATGPVVYDGTVYQVKNHSQCAVLFGDRVGLFVSPSCEAFFIPCVCSCTETPPENCCEKSYAVCIAGVTHILKIGSQYTKTWATCCEIPAGGLNPGTGVSYFDIIGFLSCDSVTNQIDFHWLFGYPGSNFSEASGTLELTDLCSNGSASETITITASIANGCEIVVNASDELIDCNDCSGDPPSNPCCDKLLWFCLNGDSQQLAVDGGDYTYDVAICCDTCTTATMRIQLQCNEETGGISLTWTFTCDGGTPEVGTTSELSAFCSSNDPMIITLDNGSVPCFLQLQVSINNAGCDECGPTSTP